jgi:hypothetical protein
VPLVRIQLDGVRRRFGRRGGHGRTPLNRRVWAGAHVSGLPQTSL